MNASAILRAVEHRPWPLPRDPWIMAQTWHELLFVHRPIAPAVLRSLIPSVLSLDTFEGEAWVGIVPFRMSNVRPRGVPPVTRLSQFPELNLRTYVTVKGISGVYFFSLDAANPVAVTLARRLFHLPYFHAKMRCERVDGTIHYRSRRSHRGAPPAEYIATYQPTAPVTFAQPATLEYWLTERYCLYTVVDRDHVYRGDIHHRGWPLQVAELEIQSDTLARAHHIDLPDAPPLLHYAHRQEVLIWALRRVL
ncbi:MAG: DUF2071 domain-containing protein [Ktedonobacteraceae bacterium]